MGDKFSLWTFYPSHLSVEQHPTAKPGFWPHQAPAPLTLWMCRAVAVTPESNRMAKGGVFIVFVFLWGYWFLPSDGYNIKAVQTMASLRHCVTPATAE